MHKNLSIPFIKVGEEQIDLTSSAKNIGFIFDQLMNSKKQIDLTCKSAWFHLRNIGRIRHFLDSKSTERLVHAFITSKLDINNALLYGLPDYSLQKLQRIQNAAARMISRLPKRCHITPVLVQLHWLPVSHRIKYKILLTVHKALFGKAPLYILDLLEIKRNTRSLRSSDHHMSLVIPKSNSVTYGDRCFRYAAPLLWNRLPTALRCTDNLNSFKRQLKTFLFSDAYES